MDENERRIWRMGNGIESTKGFMPCEAGVKSIGRGSALGRMVDETCIWKLIR
jgi:hypothetical protein